MGYKKYFTLSYDDGVEQDKKLIEILNEYGIKATFNLSSGLFGCEEYVGRIGNLGMLEISKEKKESKKIFKPTQHYIIPENEVVQVYEGFEIASHGYLHEMYQFSTKEIISKSVSEDVINLSKLFNRKIVGHAFPKGGMTKNSVKVLKENKLLYGRGIKTTKNFLFPKDPLQYHPTCWHATKDIFSILDQFIKAGPEQDDLLCYIWGHAYEFDFGTERNSWDQIKRICEKIAGRDDIVYCTNEEAFRRI
jgi:peptidoglycan/xylan/chitin deacetylase (PgdA/CDA1 family)